MEICAAIRVEIHIYHRFDYEIIWLPEDSSQLLLLSPYNIIYGFPNQGPNWINLIWFKGCIKKAFIMCLDAFLRDA